MIVAFRAAWQKEAAIVEICDKRDLVFRTDTQCETGHPAFPTCKPCRPAGIVVRSWGPGRCTYYVGSRAAQRPTPAFIFIYPTLPIHPLPPRVRSARLARPADWSAGPPSPSPQTTPTKPTNLRTSAGLSPCMRYQRPGTAQAAQWATDRLRQELPLKSPPAHASIHTC